jgi:Tol biopolymer transport system component
MMLTLDGTVKSLDFGLAKTAASTKLTQMGSTLGTVAYMSPEQARGEEVDRRSDIWSLGVILYEMITGVLPFRGDYEQAVVYGILNEDPDSMTNLRAGVPMALDGVIAKMLAKDPDLRYQNVDELPADLKAIDLGSAITRSRISTGSRSVMIPAATATDSGALEPQPAAPGKKLPAWAWAAAAALLLAIGFAAGSFLSREAEPVAELMRFEIDLPYAVEELMPRWSPDGSELYYLAQTGDEPVHVRRYVLTTGESSAVPGSEDAGDVRVSPDGRWLVIFNGNRRRYQRALRSGGAFTDIPGVESPWAWGTYGPDGRFYFTNSANELASAGEAGDVVVHTQKDSTMSWLGLPLPTADGRTVFFSHWSSSAQSQGTFRLANDAPGYQPVSQQYTFLQIVDNGYALMLPAGSTNQPVALAPIDRTTGELQGPAVPVARFNVWGYGFSSTGHLVYREQADASFENEPLFRVGSDGNAVMVSRTPPGGSDDFAAARSGSLVAIEANPENPDGVDIYIVNLDSGVQTRLTRGGDNQYAEWSPDDQYVYYRSYPDPSSRGVIMRRRADGSEQAELVLSNSSDSGGGVFHPAVTSDGSSLLFTHSVEELGTQLFRIPLGEALPLDLASAERITQAEEAVFGPDLSPDNRYVVYRAGEAILVSSIDGQSEVEVTSTGYEPVWSPDGAWIYFGRGPDREVYRVAVTAEPVFSVLGSEERVFDVTSHMHFDIASDGSLLVTMPEASGRDRSSRMWVVLNLGKEAERLAPRNP